MPNTTKQALEESLKHMLLKKPLDKITIRDITEDCGISRMAFYYHFKDIYDLVERTRPKPSRGRRPTRPGRRGFCRSLRRCRKTGPSSSTPTAVSAGSRWSGSSIS